MADPGVQLRRRIALYSFAFLALGVSMALPGAALLPLQESADAKLRDMGAIFSFRAVGYLSSSVLGGLLSDRCARRGHGIMAVGVLANSLALAAVAVGAARRGFGFSGQRELRKTNCVATCCLYELPAQCWPYWPWPARGR